MFYFKSLTKHTFNIYGFWGVLFLFITIETSSQPRKAEFENLSLDAGLSQVTVNSIEQDYLGFLWFATDDGLNRYDGYGFTLYNYSPSDPNSFQSNEISVVYEDSRKNLWVGTDGGGLYRYLREVDHFIRAGYDSLNNRSLSNQHITSIYESQGYLWIGTANGLNKLDYNINEYQKYFADSSNNSLTGNFITSICSDDEDNLWIATTSGLSKYNIGNKSFTSYRHLPGSSNSLNGNNIKSIYYSSSHNLLWIATETQGVNSYNPDTGQFTSYKFAEGKNSLSSNNTFYINEDKSGNIWISTSEAVDILDVANNKFSMLFENIGQERIGFIHTIFKDNEGIMWLGTDDNGIEKISFSESIFHSYLFNVDKTKRIPVVPIFEDSDNVLWIGSFGSGLFKMDLKTETITEFEYNNRIGKYLLVLNEDDKNNLWIGTRNEGLFVYNKNSKNIDHFTASNSDLTVNFISSIFFDSRNNIWVGTYGGGLFRFDYSTKQFTNINNILNNTSKFNAVSIPVIFEDGKGNIWIGTEAKGIYKYEPLSNSLTHYKKEKENNSLSHNEIETIIEDKKGNVWIGTYSGGLNKLDPVNEIFKYYSTKEGLINNSVYGVLEDNSGNLWLSTNKGISKFNPLSESFTNYYDFEEIKNKEFNQGSYFKSISGRMYFGGTNGFVAFYPDSIKNENINYNIVFTDFKIANKSAVINESNQLKKNISIAKEINLSYKDYVFEFEFAALNYSVQNKIKYAYKMEGFDDDWVITPPHRRFASYTSIEPGSYTFEVRVVDHSNNLSKDFASVTVFISPPFWQTWWFYTVVFLVVTIILYSIYKYRVKKILELERLRIGIASDLHDDVGATLSTLALKADMLRYGGVKVPKEESDLKRISEMGRKAVNTMSDVVWSIDARNDNFESMINKMKDVAHEILGSKDISLEFNSSGFNKSKKAPIEFRQNIYMVLKEAVNNIAKHSNADKVEINFTADNDKYNLTVKDNGDNFVEKEVNVGHGLRNMKLRASKINSQIEFKNENGFAVYVSGKIKYS